MDKQTQAVAEAMWEAVVKLNPNKITFNEMLANFRQGEDNAIMFFSTAQAAIKASGAEHLGELVRALSDISMRAGQLASGDYKACGYMPEQIAVEILHLTKDAIEKIPPELRGE